MRNELIWTSPTARSSARPCRPGPRGSSTGRWSCWSPCSATALAWSALTQADLVVRAPGRVRPVTSPVKVFNAGRGEVLSASVGGRVVEVTCREGQEVRRGDVLIRLDTERLDNEIAKRQRTIQAGEEELAELGRLERVAGAPVRGDPGEGRGGAGPGAGGSPPGQGAAGRRGPAGRAGAAERASTRKASSGSWWSARPPPGTTCAKPRRGSARRRRSWPRPGCRSTTGRVGSCGGRWSWRSKDYAVRREELAARSGGQAGEVEAARMELANLELEREQAVIRCPDGRGRDGRRREGRRHPGAGQAGGGDRRAAGFRFEAAVPSEEVGHLRVGMPARIKLDAYDYQRYGTVDGTVVFLSPDSGVPEGQRTAIYTRADRAGAGRAGPRGATAAGSSWGWPARRRS